MKGASGMTSATDKEYGKGIVQNTALVPVILDLCKHSAVQYRQ